MYPGERERNKRAEEEAGEDAYRRFASVAQTSEPEVLWHYGSFATLNGMVENQEMWATSAAYMNDSREIIEAAKILKQLINEGQHEFLKNEPPALDQTLEQSYVACFSEAFDDLSQWRGYGTSGSVTLAIGFYRNDLTAVGVPQFEMGRCFYQESKFVDGYNAIVAAMQVQVDEAMGVDRPPLTPAPVYGYKAIPYVYRGARYHIETLAGFLKNASFAAEKEWRIIGRGRHGVKGVQIRYRERGTRIVPYAKIPLKNESGTYVSPVGVIVGPSPHAECNREAVIRFLRQSGISSPVLSSKSSYVHS